ncbi:MAG: hydroxyacylglutathione hydrolase [Thermoleophilaceae bacterium]|jgi:glyoxylase-like metal-dependent hydrolase (beta-lactamase superfamily II)|nr:hydroxyacylglutathione hydrolase [Thermoleophilaceae bacterium]
MIIERVLNDQWLSNSYLVGDEPGGTGIVIDTSGPSQPLFDAAEKHDLTVTHLLLTHHHADHVAENHLFKERYGVEIMAHPLEAARLLDVDTTIDPGEKLTIGGLEIEAVHTPGHTDGMLNFLINGSEIFTGDTLFKGSIGGVKAPGSTTFEDMKHSIMEVLMKLPHEVSVRPGHTDPTTIGDEWENNAFVRVWRGLDPEGEEHCTVWDQGATLVLFAPDYDGGHKAWVRWDESGADDIVPGSQVVRA